MTASPKYSPPEIRLHANGTLDEVVATGAYFHLEQMNSGHWWLCVECGGRSVSVWLRSGRKISAEYEECEVASESASAIGTRSQRP